MPAELRLDGLGKLAGGEGERSLVEFGNHLAVREPAEFAALRSAARIFGDFLGDLAEVFAGLDALGDFFDLGLRLGLILGGSLASLRMRMWRARTISGVANWAAFFS